MIVIRKKENNSLGLASLYIFFGGICWFLSLVIIPNNSILVASTGFFVNYFFFLLWFLFFRHYSHNNIERVMNTFCKAIFILAVFSGLLGIYQVFVDTSIGGYVVNEIYGDVDKMASGTFQSRATGLFGSAQNYGCFMGLAFCIGYFYRFKNGLLWLLCLIIVFLGVVVSNSRSASSCVVIGMTLGVYFYNKQKSKSVYRLIPYFLLLLALIVVAAQFVMDNDLDKYSRLLQFNNKPAREIYADTYAHTDFAEYIVGHGLGYRSYTVNQLLGDKTYYESFGEYYQSCESFFMTIWTQGGLVLFIPFLYFVINIIISSYKDYSCPIILCVIINMMFTPSLTGLPISFTCWPILLYELHKKAVKRKEYRIPIKKMVS